MKDILKSLWLDFRPYALGLLAGIAVCLSFSSCRTAKTTAVTPHAEQIAATPSTSDTVRTRVRVADTLPPAAKPADSVRVTPVRWLVDKVLHKTRRAKLYTHATNVAVNGKKSTVSIYQGPTTITTAGKKATVAAGDNAAVVQAGKKAGPIIQADSGATVQVATSRKGPAAAAGQDAAASQTKAAGWPWWLWVVGVAALGYGGYRVYRKYFTPV